MAKKRDLGGMVCKIEPPELEVILVVSDEDGNDLMHDVETTISDDGTPEVRVTVEGFRLDLMPTNEGYQPTELVTGVIDTLLGATNSATEALKTLRSKLNERT